MKSDFEAEKERILEDVKKALGAEIKSPRKSTRKIPNNPVVLNKLAPSYVDEETNEENQQPKVFEEFVVEEEYEILSTNKDQEFEIQFVT
jgi:hypothetical protein